MKKTIAIPGIVRDKIFVPDNQRNWHNALGIYDGDKVVVAIGPIKKPRSVPQNSYLFGGPYKIISDATGQDKDSIHSFFKDMFLKEYTNGPIPKIKSTSKLSTVEFIEYYRKIIQFAAEFLGLYIPEPLEEEMWKSIERDGQK